MVREHLRKYHEAQLAEGWRDQLLTAYNTTFRTEKRRTTDQILDKTVKTAYKYSSLLGIQDQVDTELAIFHTESRFDPTATGDHNRSFGIGQTARKQEDRWRRFWWKRYGILLEKSDSVETQVAYAIAEYAFCLGKAHGDVKDAVRRYNGAGPKARAYVVRVMRARRLLFAHQFKAGETVTNWENLAGSV